MENTIAIIGAGPMAQAHWQALHALGLKADIYGRGESSAAAFTKATGARVFRGNLSENLSQRQTPLRFVIIATGLEALAHATQTALTHGAQHILVEKPGGIDLQEIKKLAKVPRANAIKIAYNRRFLPASRTVKTLCQEDGGITSLHFEFNENIPLITSLEQHNKKVKNNWFFANSTHIVDMAFFLGGLPSHIDKSIFAHCVQAGTPATNSTPHLADMSYVGCGQYQCAQTQAVIAFSYLADWRSAGRWGIEICTRKRRFIMKPIETLMAIERGSFGAIPIPLQDEEPEDLKAGLYNMLKTFTQNPEHESFLSIAQQSDRLQAFSQIITPPKSA